MNFDDIYRKGVERIWKEDSKSQLHYLQIVSEARSMQMLEYEQLHAFFIPNNDYMVNYFGTEITDVQHGCYDLNHNCFWDNCLVFPIYNVADRIVSLAGFNPFKYLEAKETGDKTLNYYLYNSSDTFKKHNFLFYTEGTYEKAYRDGYVFLVDGVFDALSLDYAGFNAFAMMGSSLSSQILTLLRFIKRVIIISDNDSAGYSLYERLKKQYPKLELIKQGYGKDIDEALKGANREQVIYSLNKFISEEPKSCIKI